MRHASILQPSRVAARVAGAVRAALRHRRCRLLMLVPGLDWGWWSAIGGEGNPVFGSTESTTGTAWEWLVPLCSSPCCSRPCRCSRTPRSACSAPVPSTGARADGCSRSCSSVWCTPLIGIPIGAALALSSAAPTSCGVYLRAVRQNRLDQRGDARVDHRAHRLQRRDHRRRGRRRSVLTPLSSTLAPHDRAGRHRHRSRPSRSRSPSTTAWSARSRSRRCAQAARARRAAVSASSGETAWPRPGPADDDLASSTPS